MGVMLILAMALVVAAPAAGQRAPSPADATVFIRLLGSVQLEIEDGLSSRVVDIDQVEIGTGSGFVISPHGYILTNEHVISSDQYLVTRGAQRVRVTLKVSTIHVCFGADTIARRGLFAPCVAANVVAADPALDLAVLFISGSELPYIALGDSEAVATGLPVDALGYPLGREVEVAKLATAADFVPEVSTTPGAVSALRGDAAGDRRYLQITNSLNPGNSGGPVLNRDGFAVGVVRMRLKEATGIGFAIPINLVKDFLESRGIDQSLPVRRLRLGSFHNLEAKGIGLRLPEGWQDLSPHRSRVETDATSADVVLRIDRVLSPWPLPRLEQALLDTQAFEAVTTTTREARSAKASGTPPLLLGSVEAVEATGAGREAQMTYALLDLGPEKLVARYLGSVEWMAFNESVLRESLASLQGRAWGVRPLLSPDTLEWSAGRAPDAPSLPVGWDVASSGPSACARVSPPDMVATAMPPADLTLSLRAAWWPDAAVTPEAAAAGCSRRRGALGPASYVLGVDWLGVAYNIEGVFARTGTGRLAQLEVLSTDDKSALARALLAVWLSNTTR